MGVGLGRKKEKARGLVFTVSILDFGLFADSATYWMILRCPIGGEVCRFRFGSCYNSVLLGSIVCFGAPPGSQGRTTQFFECWIRGVPPFVHSEGIVYHYLH